MIDDEADSFDVVPCKYGWVYNTTGLFTSAVTEMNWVCDDAWKGPFTQAVFFVGSGIGSLSFGVVSDRFGRIVSFVTSNVIAMACGIALPYCKNFYAFAAVRFVTGLTHITYFFSIYLLAVEYVEVSKRSFIGNMSLAVGLALGGSTEAWILKYLGDWKLFNQILSLQGAFIIVAPFIVDESMRWLITQGKIDRATKILRRIAKINGRKLPDETVVSFRAMANKQFEESMAAKEKKPGLVSIFRTPWLRRNATLAILTWVLTITLFDAHIRNISNLGYDIYTTFSISAALELPADLLSILVLETLGRRWSSCSGLLLSGVLMIACGVLRKGSTVLVVVAMLGRFFITFAINTATTQIHEIMPTEVRAQGTALANAFSAVALIASPYIAYSGAIDRGLPFYILGGGGILACFVAVGLPETAREKLPDTLEQAREFGKDQPFFYVPGLGNRGKFTIGEHNGTKKRKFGSFNETYRHVKPN